MDLSLCIYKLKQKKQSFCSAILNTVKKCAREGLVAAAFISGILERITPPKDRLKDTRRFYCVAQFFHIESQCNLILAVRHSETPR